MLKVMIVEDEPVIRAGLKHYFPWYEMGISSIVEAENGKEGIETGLRERPDLIITDIRMPELNGLDMIERLTPLLPDSVFMILSGYNDFEYARQAIRLGTVKQYILKPLEYEPSFDAVIECIRLLETQQEERRRKLEWEADFHEAAQWKYSQTVKFLLEESDQDEGAARVMLGDPLSAVYVPLAACCFMEKQAAPERKWRQEFERIVMQAAAAVFSQEAMPEMMAHSLGKKLYLVLVMKHEEPDSLAVFSEALLALQETIKQDRGSYLYVAIGEPANHMNGLGQALKAAAKALNRRYADPECLQFTDTFLPASVSPPADHVLQLGNDDRNALLACLELGDREETYRLMKKLSGEASLLMSGLSADRWLAFLQEIVNITLTFAYKHEIPIAGVHSGKLLDLTFVDDFRTLPELFRYLADWVIHLSSRQEKPKASAQQELLIFDQIRTFIERNIDQDLTLQMVAEQFFYNPSYLSRLFKTKRNQNYLAFVTDIRIRYAQRLLKDPQYLVTDICAMCGYKSYKHFVKMFRLVTGMTPTDYRKTLGLQP